MTLEDNMKITFRVADYRNELMVWANRADRPKYSVGVKCFDTAAEANQWIADPTNLAQSTRDAGLVFVTHGELGKACQAAGLEVPKRKAQRINALKACTQGTANNP